MDKNIETTPSSSSINLRNASTVSTTTAVDGNMDSVDVFKYILDLIAKKHGSADAQETVEHAILVATRCLSRNNENV